MENELENTMESLGLDLPQDIDGMDINLEDIEEMLRIVREQISTTKNDLQDLVSLHIPKYMKRYTTSNEVHKSLSSIHQQLEQTVKFLASTKGPQGAQVKFKKQKSELNHCINQTKIILKSMKMIKSIYDKNMLVRRMIACGEIDCSTDLMLEIEKDLEFLFEQSKDNNMLSNKENFLPGSEDKGTNLPILREALIIETAQTHASLKLLVQETWERMVLFQTYSASNRIVIRKVLNKSAKQIEECKKFELDSLTENPPSKEVTLYTLIVALLRLNCLSQFLSDILSKKFFQMIVVSLFSLGSLSITSSGQEDIIEVKLENGSHKTLDFWKNNSRLIELFSQVLEDASKSLGWLTSCFTEEDSPYFEFDVFSEEIWGNRSQYVNASIVIEDTRSVLGLCVNVLYMNTPHIYTEVTAKDQAILLDRVSIFESSLEKLGLCVENKTNNILSSYVRDLEENIINKWKNNYLLQCRDIIKDSYYKTVMLNPETIKSSSLNVIKYIEIAEKLSADDLNRNDVLTSRNALDDTLVNEIKKIIQTKLSETQPNAKKAEKVSKAYFSNERDAFTMERMEISDVVYRVVGLVNDTMNTLAIAQGAKKSSQAFLISACSLCRDVFFLFYTLADSLHQDVISTAKYSAVFFNDCMFLCHVIGCLSYKYSSLLPNEASSSMVLFDLIPKFREKGKTTLNTAVTYYKTKIHQQLKSQEITYDENGLQNKVLLDLLELTISSFTEYLSLAGKHFKGVLSDRVFIYTIGIIVEYTFEQLGKIFFNTQHPIHQVFNVLDLIELKYKLQTYLDYIFSDLLSVDSIKISMLPELDANVSIGKIIPSYLKYDLIAKSLNETLSLEIFNDMTSQGQLYLLTTEEIRQLRKFLFLE